MPFTFHFLKLITLFWVAFSLTFYTLRCFLTFGEDRFFDQVNGLLFTLILSFYFLQEIRKAKVRHKIHEAIREARCHKNRQEPTPRN